MDSIDPNYFYSTGTPVNDGLNPSEIKYIIDNLLEKNIINMDIVEKENILKQFLDKAYVIYSERSNLYKWEKIELKLLQFQNDSVYISQKDMYVVRFVIVEQNASKYDTKRSERHLIHDTFKYSVVTHHVKNLLLMSY